MSKRTETIAAKVDQWAKVIEQHSQGRITIEHYGGLRWSIKLDGEAVRGVTIQAMIAFIHGWRIGRMAGNLDQDAIELKGEL